MKMPYPYIARMTSLLLAVFLLSALLSIVKPLFAQQAVKQPVAASVPPAKVAEKSTGTSQGIPDLSRDFILDFETPVSPETTYTMAIGLDWTRYQVHRVNDDSPLDITLTGNITSDIATIWTLTPQPTRAFAPLDLARLEDVLGQHYPTIGQIAVPLTWTISLDGGPFEPMQVTSDYTLRTVFPPGTHTFRLQITGALQPYQPDGYYWLQLWQNLTPQL